MVQSKTLLVEQYSGSDVACVSVAIAYPCASFFYTASRVLVNNGIEPPCVTFMKILERQEGESYLLLIIAAESLAVVRERIKESKQRFGIDSKPVTLNGLELELRLGAIDAQKQFKQIMTGQFDFLNC